MSKTAKTAVPTITRDLTPELAVSAWDTDANGIFSTRPDDDAPDDDEPADPRWAALRNLN